MIFSCLRAHCSSEGREFRVVTNRRMKTDTSDDGHTHSSDSKRLQAQIKAVFVCLTKKVTCGRCQLRDPEEGMIEGRASPPGEYSLRWRYHTNVMMSIGRSLAIVCGEAGPPRGIPGRVTQVPPGGLAGLPEDPRKASALEDQSAIEYPNCDPSELGRIAANQGKCEKAFYTDHSIALILCLAHESNAYCVVCGGIFFTKPKALSPPSRSSPPR